MFRKYYPNYCVIIDYSKLFIETPSSLDEAAACCSNCSGCYRDRATDAFVIRDSVFFTKITASGSSYGR